ncbi:MAG: endonuclease/exonuclease/phosphatase family protein [Verrucomicrobia bacterium]|nr:MAG: endonuclease/exonuclease/phosphatase family protein [Verrucomicrobiota bacterium]TAE89338.1 MAG: endonuclease/exonuclease/phosphatase family protein [Verrucomicrobiota bacterium]TAF27786.1 MAG: endonuclease/exonuclease/phosphatase family protein [Verrucomicrobiota bacterium]TAF42635.1 MAG: endonuclease/exonuclease/phosphatase family protein [Verrucomicrobiota bacterium]
MGSVGHSCRRAPGLLGALLLSLLLVACEKREAVAAWSEGSAGRVDAVEVKGSRPSRESSTAGNGPQLVAHKGAPLRFLSYNVENWLSMDRQRDGRDIGAAPKPKKERLAVARLIAKAAPDILGVSEIGDADDVRDLQEFLLRAGHPMPHFHFNRGSDPTRGLALLSRQPIGKTVVRDDLSYRSKGRSYSMQRGILDATVDSSSGRIRFLGVHLKSKRETDEGDQADMRLHEAHLLRREIDIILAKDPQTRLVVYGDLNDSRQSSAVRTVQGRGQGSGALLMVALKDSRGDYWTHHWQFEDIYSRIDYVMVSSALRQLIDWDRCAILDGPDVSIASDHRPLLLVFR